MKKFLASIDHYLKYLIYLAGAVILFMSFQKAFEFRALTHYDYKITDNMGVSYDGEHTDDFGEYIPHVLDETTGERVPNEHLILPETFDVEKLFADSDLVVSVTATDKKELKYQSLLAEATVDKVYKGDKTLVNQSVYVYERACLYGMRPSLYFYWSRDGYNVMLGGESYILFLSFNDMPEGYKYSEKDKKTYLLTNVYNSKYSVNTYADIEKLPKISDYNQKLYKDLKYYDIFAISNEQLEAYKENREIVLNKLNDLPEE